MEEVIALPNRSYPPLTREFGPHKLPLGITKLELRATRDNWPGDPAVDIIGVRCFLSPDGGQTWSLLIGWTACGSDLVDPETQQPALYSSATIPVSEPDNPNRQIRVFAQNYKRLKTQVSVFIE